MMRFVIVGFGSIGRRHLQRIKSVYPQAKVSVLRQKTKSGNLGGLNHLVDEVFFDINKALAWKPDAVVIANPAPFHVPTALKFAKANVHLFVEKPLSDSLEGIDVLIKECKKRNLVLPQSVDKFENLSGLGVKAVVENKHILIGTIKLMKENNLTLITL